MQDEILGLRNIEAAPQEVLLAAHNNIRRLLADAKLGDLRRNPLSGAIQRDRESDVGPRHSVCTYQLELSARANTKLVRPRLPSCQFGMISSRPRWHHRGLRIPIALGACEAQNLAYELLSCAIEFTYVPSHRASLLLL